MPLHEHGSLSEQGSLFQTLVENALAGIYLFQEGRMIYVNPTFEKIVGRSFHEILEADIFEFIHPEDRNEVRSKARERLAGNLPPEPYTLRIHHPRKGIRWLSLLADRIEYAGKPALLGNLIDITERVEAEEKYRLLVENAHEAIVVAQAGRLRFVNAAAVTMLGFTEKEFLSRPFLDLIHPEDREMVAENYQRRLRGEDVPSVYAFRLLHKEGRIVWVEIRAVRIFWDNGPATLNFLADITDRKRAEDELRQSEERFRTMASVAKDAVIEMDAHGNVAFWNDAAREIFGYTAEEALGRNVHTLLAPKRSQEEWRRVFPDFQGTGKGLGVGSTRELYALRKDGREIPVELSLAAMERQDGWHAVGILRDISERKAAEEALKRERDWARTYLDLVGVIVVSLKEDGGITLLNKKGHEVLGYAPGALLGKNWFDTCIPERIREEIRKVYRGLMSGDVEPFELYENPVLTASGEERMIAWHNAPLTDESGRIVAAISAGEDVTEKRKLEMQLRQAQKMEAVGRLAGGVAHDFNNALTTILGYAELMLASFPPEAPFREAAHEIRQAAKRAASLTQQLLAFSRKQVIQPKMLDLNAVLRSLQNMLGRLIGEDIEVETRLAPDLGRVEMDPSQVDQILMNLAVNARDAMPSGGKMIIETANVDLDRSHSLAHGVELEPGPFVRLTVSDTGVGMDEETRQAVFEPFFTTKEPGKGTGLGLSTVYGIVKQNRGFIWVYSEPGQGTTFRIYFPRVDKAMAVEAGESLGERRLSGSETVLLVEDEDALRDLARRILEHRGYRVLSARNGREALQVAQSYEGTIHLLLTDVVMPGMSGRELADRLRQSRPAMRMLYMSGYPDEALASHGALRPGAALLEKPFTPEELARKVRRVLETRLKS